MNKPVTVERTATTTSGSERIPFAINTKLIYISNDSDTYDILINFDKTTDESGAFTVKAGEVISDIPMACISISVSGINGDAPYRVMGV